MKLKRLSILAACSVLAGCGDSPLDIDPTASLPAEEGFSDEEGLQLGVRGAYDALQFTGAYTRNLVVFPDLYADNLTFTGTFTTDQEVSNRDIRPTNGAIEGIWGAQYEGINRANNVLASIPQVSGLEPEVADLYRGEALFLRSLYYFNLVRFFGGVPIITEPTLSIAGGTDVARSTAEEVYALIEEDLETAAQLLPGASAPEDATQSAANALLAKVYLQQGQCMEALQKANQVIESGDFSLVETFADLFQVQNTSESIFEVQYSVNDANALAFWFFPRALGGRRGFAPTDELASLYEEGDERLDASIATAGNQLFGQKYFRVGVGDDNVIVLRLAEMYLIRAEANLCLGAPAAEVREDINVVRNRAGLPDLPATVDTRDELVEALLEERRLEFAFEGQRFFDLRRLGVAEEVLGIPEYRLLFPIPQDELDVNELLVQNPGY